MRMRLLPALAATLLIGAAGTGPSMAATLYDDLGGQAGVAAIVSDTIDAAAADPRTANKFDNIALPRLKERISEQICTLTGGPCNFKGISMKGSHAYLQLHDSHFNALVEDMEAAMDKQHINTFTQNRLLAILAPMRRDIVTK